MKRLAVQNVTDLIRAQGLKLTPQRLAIVEYLQQCTHHPTADEVWSAVNAKFPMASRATVYNTLNWLLESGQLAEIQQDGVMRFDPNLDPHHHFVCRRCGRVEDVDYDVIAPWPQCTLPGRHVIEGFELTLRGLCATCVQTTSDVTS
ncbi:MAG: transcriptional repressor [Chloracidobacterium sp.]|uniref:Transcriptional repressor n=1 Tax=Chloracidobacterium validum TaxID=2821543 RepID=A0ABX8BBX8_9BACT|nr:transcriptional repressor [Chloracidobacterium validum]QUW03280.1 transcriptional repressor [Chloracidobacterium validum]